MTQRFGAYILDEFLAAGGMAEVFIAHRADNPNGLPVCIKRVLPNFLQQKDFITMFQDEAALASRLDHENVVRVFDFGAAEGTLFMAMELVDGLDLSTVQKGAKKLGTLLSVSQALEIAVQICRGLHHAHTLTSNGHPLRVVHRDVSPQNVLLDMKGRVKVTDFGIAKAQGRETHTRTGIVKGKLGYMAPEQALGQDLDHRTDQFAAGVVLWEMLTGQRLFHDRSELATLEKILKRPTDPPSRYRPQVPQFVDDVVLKALAKRREDRFADMAAFEQALGKCLQAVPPTTGVEMRLDELLGLVRGLYPRGQRSPSSASASAAPGTQPTPASAPGLPVTVAAPTEVSQPPTAALQGTHAVVPTVAMGPPPGVAVPLQAQPAASSLLVTGTGHEAHPAQGSANFKVVTAGGTMPAALVPATQAGLGQPGMALGQPGLGQPGLPQPGFPQPGAEGTPSGSFIPWAGEVPPASPAPAAGVSRKAAALLGAVALAVGVGLGMLLGGTGQGQLCAPPATEPKKHVMATMLHDAVDVSLASNDFKSAARDIEKGLKLHGSARGYTQLGKLHTQLGNLGSALDAYRCAVLLEPASPEARAIQERLTDGAAQP